MLSIVLMNDRTIIVFISIMAKHQAEDFFFVQIEYS